MGPSLRNPSWCRGISRLELLLGLAVIGVVSAGIMLLSRPSWAVDARSSLTTTAEPLLAAAQRWHDDNPNGCPTLGRLVEDGYLPSTVTRDDPWGNTLRLRCENSAFTVISPGKDGQLETPDDIRIPSK